MRKPEYINVQEKKKKWRKYAKIWKDLSLAELLYWLTKFCGVTFGGEYLRSWHKETGAKRFEACLWLEIYHLVSHQPFLPCDFILFLHSL